MTSYGSIKRRLVLLLAGVAALLSVLSWGMVASFARQAAERTQDNVLAASATSIAETLRSEGGRIQLDLPYAAFSMLGAVSDDRVFYRITADGQTLTGYDDLVSLTAPAVGGEVFFDTTNYRGYSVRVASIRRTILSGETAVPVTVMVAQTRQGIGVIAQDLSQTAAILSLAFFVLAIALSAIAAGASLRPLRDIAQAVARRGPSDLRPLRRNAPEELAPLLSALNSLMGRLDLSFRRSEDFITEAAHRVRTPLATVRAHAEIALRSAENREERDALRRMIRAVDESSRSAGQLLDHATVAFRADDLERVRLDLGQLAARVAGALDATAEMKDIRLSLNTQAVDVQGDPVLLENALRNVVDNAIKYSPPDTDITISVHSTSADGQIEIVDEGPGFGKDDPHSLLGRFQRGSNASGVVGSGLGLTIADEVLRAHNGRIELTPNTGGRGACVLLSLPLA